MKAFLQRSVETRFELRKYSGWGFASFVIALACALIIILEISLVLHNQNDPAFIHTSNLVDPYITWALVILSALGAVLGLVGVIQKGKKKLFGVVGLIVNAIFFLAIIVMYVLNFLAFFSRARPG